MAAMMAAKLPGLGDGLHSDLEKDANTLLMELDKGLRSGKAGEQCESIVRYPQLFEKYPFPILINSSFLKLADVFRVGSNFLRLCVLRVTQQSEKHLEKITSVDEFVRRIYAVSRSNDPVARAITLRTLGSVTCIIAEHKNVHHCIITSLDSNDSVELEAAIFAASLFAAKSKSFARSICGKLAEMIEQLSVPLDIKLKLVSILEHMDCDLDTYQQVRTLCTKMLDDYPSCKFVLAVLRTLTHLSAGSLVDIPIQVDLLLKYLNSDVRTTVRLAALRDLRLLVRRAPHMWKSHHIQSLCVILKQDPSDSLLLGIVQVLSALSYTVALANLSEETGSLLLDCCLSCCYHNNVMIVAFSAELLVGIVVEKCQAGLVERACSVLEMVLTVAVSSGTVQDCCRILKALGRLCEKCVMVMGRFVDAITSCLSQVISDGAFNCDKELRALSLCDGLSAIGGLRGDVLLALVPDLVAILKDVSRRQDNTNRLILTLTRVLFQASADDGLPSDVAQLIALVGNDVDGWTAYKIGRQAARYSHSAIAAAIFSKLTTSACTEQFYFWLTALKDCCLAEHSVQQASESAADFVDNVMQAEDLYQTGIVSLKAAATALHPLTFQIQYAQLRAEMFLAFVHVLHAVSSFRTSPPPAIAASLAITTGLEKHRCDHVLIQFQKCRSVFLELDNKYRSLRQSSFDADMQTLANISQLQQTCRLMAHTIDSILCGPANEGKSSNGVEIVSAATVSGQSQDGTLWSATRDQVLDLIKRTLELPGSGVLSHEHMECIEQVVLLLARCRHCLPRYAFQRLQTTEIKLALCPAPNASGDPIIVHYDTNLTLKVEGIVLVGSTQKRFHDVHSVEVTVSSVQQSRSQKLLESAKQQENPTNQMVQTTTPHNDYFSVQFLLAFPITGLHQVNIEAFVVDRDGTRWNTGSKATLTVKSYNEAIQRQQQLHYANQPRHAAIIPPPPTSRTGAGTTSKLN